MGEVADHVQCDAAALQPSVLDHILEHHKVELFLDPELDVDQLFHLNILNSYVYM